MILQFNPILIRESTGQRLWAYEIGDRKYRVKTMTPKMKCGDLVKAPNGSTLEVSYIEECHDTQTMIIKLRQLVEKNDES